MFLFFPFVFFIAMIGLIVFLIVYANKKEKERTLALQGVAARLGWSFAPTAPLNMIAGLDRFALFGQGHSRQIKNFMYGEARGVKAAVFDYIYVTGSGKHRHTHSQTIAYLEPANLNLPVFALRPENFVIKMLAAFGYQDIDFGQRPAFSSQYVLRGQDELAIRQTFNDRVLSFYESYAGTSTDAGGNQILLFRAGYRQQPQEIESYVGLALHLLELFPRY